MCVIPTQCLHIQKAQHDVDESLEKYQYESSKQVQGKVIFMQQEVIYVSYGSIDGFG